MKKGKLFDQIRQKVREIPEGKVATYGLIAKSVGISDARKVGWAIYNNQDETVPCHRVVMKDGSLAENYSLGGWQEQKDRLVSEGVTFKTEKKVDLEKYLML